MNILHITTYVQGGAGKVIRDLVLEQKKNGHKVIVVMNEKEEPGYENYSEYINDFKDNNIEFYNINSTFKRDIYLNIEAADFVKKLIIRNKIDIIHSHATTPSMVAMLAKSTIEKYIPILQTMHGWGINKSEQHEKMDISILNLVNKVITVSKADKKLLISKGVEEKKIDVVYNGIKRTSKGNLNYSLKNKSKINIGCIGSVCIRKNQVMILEALKLLQDKDIKVYFIGEGDEIENLELKAKKYNIENSVEFLGYKENAQEYIKEFDYIILPSISEGLPITILESYMERKPVIVSNIDVFKELVSKEEGFIFDLKKINSLLNVLKNAKMIKNSDKYMKMCYKVSERYEKNFKLENMNTKYLEIYSKL